MRNLFRRMTVCLVLLSAGLPALVRAEEATAPAQAGAVESKHDDLVGKEINYSEAVWTIIIFVVALAILYPTAWKQVLAGLKAREQRIRGDIAEAEAARTKAEATLKQYQAQLATAEQTVRQMIAQATADANRVADGLRKRGQEEAEETKKRALAEIEQAHKQAVADIYAQGAELAGSIAEKVLKRVLTDDDRRELVRANIEQIGTMVKN